MKKYSEEASKKENESQVHLSRVESESMVGQVVRHMLFHNQHSPGIPVSKDDLNKLLTSENENHKHKKNLLNTVLPEAQVRFSEQPIRSDLTLCLYLTHRKGSSLSLALK